MQVLKKYHKVVFGTNVPFALRHMIEEHFQMRAHIPLQEAVIDVQKQIGNVVKLTNMNAGVLVTVGKSAND